MKIFVGGLLEKDGAGLTLGHSGDRDGWDGAGLRSGISPQL